MKRVIPTIFLALLLVACNSAGNPAGLPGSSWVLTQIGGQPVVSGTAPTLVFENEQAGGNASCNHFGGSYKVDGQKLTFEALTSTLMACMGEGLMEQESAYLAALQSAASYQITDGQLLILDAGGKVILTFAPQDMTLEGKTWQLTAYNDGSALVSVLEKTQVSAEFAEGNVSGSAGCNSYGGPYKQDGQKLTLGPLAATEMACMDPAGVMEQETAYLTALSKVTRFRMEANRLTLYGDNDTVLAEFVKK